MNAATPTSAGAPAATPANGGFDRRYQPLFQVWFQHSYYNGPGGDACPDLTVTPTPDCARLMRMLGMAFKDRGTGFSVLIDQASSARAASYIAGRLQAGAGLTWLTFLLTPTNPGFIGITNLPITLNPSTQNLHGSNLTAASDGVITLDGARPATETTPATPPTLFAVKGPTVTVPTPADARVTLTDFAGEPAVCSVTRTPGVATVRLTSAPFGLYTLTTAPAEGPAQSMSFIYAPGPPAPLAVLDLALVQSPGGAGEAAVFPYTAQVGEPSSSSEADPDGGAARVTVTGPNPVSLSLPFTARQTVWEYYVVAQGRVGGRGGSFSDLTITGKGASFTGVADVLPNGDPAMKFTVGDPLPLQQTSTQVFSLRGHRGGATGARDQISIARLPTAPPAPVWPARSGDLTTGTSEIYVYV